MTIYDIAREAKVSPSTVSRVISGNAKVKPEKEELIRSIMARNNFRPNAIAQSLIGGQSKTIGLLVADIRNPFYAALSLECEIAAKRANYRVMLCNAFNDDSIEDDSLDMFAEHRADAIIQIGCRVDDLVGDPAYAAHINSLAIPFVSTGKLDGCNMYTYGIDNAACIDIAFEHLRELGHKRIALSGGRLSVRSTYEKWTRYIYLHGKYGIPINTNYVQESHYDFNGGVECMNRLLALPERPTAVIAISDHCAVGVLSAAHKVGLSVPGDISLISHDNTFLTEITAPRLTGIDYDYKKLGGGLVSTAIALINKKEPPREAFITPTLNVKDSCAKIYETDV
ncbi:MAG: LacI family transcriptional regulator [Clostridiales bacterium]|nr:LacI family transcriptional regulator [Clostridiales bacterium]